MHPLSGLINLQRFYRKWGFYGGMDKNAGKFLALPCLGEALMRGTLIINNFHGSGVNTVNSFRFWER